MERRGRSRFRIAVLGRGESAKKVRSWLMASSPKRKPHGKSARTTGGPLRRPPRLLVLDVDSTLIRQETINELAREKGVGREVTAITEEAMQGRMDFDESLRRRCAFLEGLPEAALERVYSRLELMPGAEELLDRLRLSGCRVALATGGFCFVTDRLQKRLGIEHACANRLEVRGGSLTGRVLPPIVNAAAKALFLERLREEFGLRREETAAIGDGANDLLMLRQAGLGIAFNAKAGLRRGGGKSLRSVRGPSLAAVLPALGLPVSGR
jgi:phosphoserine phosphatase